MIVFFLFQNCAAASPNWYDEPVIRFANIQSATSPQLGVRGIELLCIADFSGERQAWRMYYTGSYQHQVTFELDGVRGAWWSPVNKNVLITAVNGRSGGETQLFLVDPYNGSRNRITPDDGASYYFGTWSPDGSRFAYSVYSGRDSDFEVYEYEIDSQLHHHLFDSRDFCRPASYSQDNRYLAATIFQSARASEITVYDRDTGDNRIVCERTENEFNGNPMWTPDGTGFYFLTNQDREYVGLAYWNFSDSDLSWYETPEADIEQFALSPDGRHMVWAVNHDGYSAFHYRNLVRGNEIGSYRLPRGVIHDFAFSADASALAFTLAMPNRPTDVWVYRLPDDKLLQATYCATGGIAAQSFVEPEAIRYESFDGTEIPAFWYYKLGPSSQKRGAVILLHDGPEWQAKAELDPLVYFLLDRGFAILVPNVRGSSGYGVTYERLDDGGQRGNAVKDVLSAAEWLAAQPGIDAQKLVVAGKGCGGYLALSALAEAPDRWAAGISINGISDPAGCFELADAEGRVWYEECRDFTSPGPLQDRIAAPLLIVHGEYDTQVPRAEADRIVAALRRAGQPVEYVLLEREGHDIVNKENRMWAYFRIGDFLRRHVLNR